MEFEQIAISVSQYYTRCYLAIMPGDLGFYEIDIEVIPQAVIFISVATNTDDLDEARQVADELEETLAAAGVFVYETRDEWEEVTIEDIV